MRRGPKKKPELAPRLCAMCGTGATQKNTRTYRAGDGRRMWAGYCRACERSYRHEHAKRLARQKKAWRAAHAAEIPAASKRWYEKNRALRAVQRRLQRKHGQTVPIARLRRLQRARAAGE